jgi:DNA repair exonuclease SbcCD ATPase subunit
MKIISVEWKNFNSYGNSLSRIDFERDSGDLYLLLGGNGNGKSTISEVITFCLYGKLEKKNKSDLPNRINKNLWCRIQIKTKNKLVTITRGISPGLFEVDIDGVPYETSGNSNVQDYLEYELYDIPFQVFKNIIVLSINDFRSFLTMGAGDKRNIIDRLFGFTLINDMRDEIRSERKSIKDNLRTISDELNILEDSIQSINQKIKLLEKDKKADNDKLVIEYQQKVNELVDKKKSTEDILKKIKAKETEINDSLDDKKKLVQEVGFELRSIKSKLEIYENSKCPTCGSDLDDDKHHGVKTDLLNKQEIKTDKLKGMAVELKDLQLKSTEITKKINEVNQSVIKVGLMVNQYNSEITKLQSESSELDATYLNELIEENRNKTVDRKGKESDLRNEDTFLELVESVLGDDGVKNLAMKTILPSLNQSISFMAKQIHLPYSIKFDDKFNCIVNSLGEEIKPNSMSTGERKKADFIIIIALLKLLKVRYPSLNLLFLDEIFSSIDSAGVYEIIKILSDVSKENHLNTWVINHTELPMELFDKRVEAVREGGFSKLKIETIS